MKLFYTLVLLLAVASRPVAQQPALQIDEVEFFKNESIIDATFFLDIRHLMKSKMKEGEKFPARLIAKLDNNTEIREPVTLEVRGHFRRENCYLPPLKVNFKSAAAPLLSPLGSLKLVNVCKTRRAENIQYLLKEYLVYKIYNLITEKSLRVRLLKINYTDSFNKNKAINEYAFLVEDVKDMAKRNECVERKRRVNHTELTDRKQMTRVAIFEYMIGNLDWAVPVRHNIKLIVSKKDTNTIAFAVPYDFDHSGLVKADYALPPPEIEITDVTVRTYRGFTRSMEELQEVADEFLDQKENIYKLINEFDLLSEDTREQMISYLDEFFKTISKPRDIQIEFIDHARKK